MLAVRETRGMGLGLGAFRLNLLVAAESSLGAVLVARLPPMLAGRAGFLEAAWAEGAGCAVGFLGCGVA